MSKDRRTRRVFLGETGAALALLTSTLSAGEALTPTPRQSTGPYYPSSLPLDADNDLVEVRGSDRRAAGIVTHVTGRVIDARGRPIRGARVEIWQCNAFGRYHHPRDTRDAPVDPYFQGYGRSVTGNDGLYRFRTIKPVAYPGRTPHIHFAVSGEGFERLVTQMYVAGEPRNAGDVLLNRVRDARARARLVVALEPVPGAPGELSGRFDLVLETDAGRA